MVLYKETVLGNFNVDPQTTTIGDVQSVALSFVPTVRSQSNLYRVWKVIAQAQNSFVRDRIYYSLDLLWIHSDTQFFTDQMNISQLQPSYSGVCTLVSDSLACTIPTRITVDHDRIRNTTRLLFRFRKCRIAAFKNKTVQMQISFYDTSAPTCPLGSSTYSIQSGDTCYLISETFSIKVEQLQSANQIDCANLSVGQPLCIPGTILYSVRSGDTCSSISHMFGITLAQLLDANDGLICDDLQIGQELIIVNTSAYKIQPGNTCFAISEQFQITLDDLHNANPGIDCDSLQIGDIISIPQVTTYVVNSGTTCASIAQLFNISVEQLLACNPGTNCNNLQIGQALYVPLASTSRCDPTEYPDPITPSTSKPPIVGFWYLKTDANCVEESQTPVPTPDTATLSAYFEYYIAHVNDIDMKNFIYPCFNTVSFSGGLQYNNYFYKAYTLGSGTTNWINDAQYVTPDFITTIREAGYNCVILDVESRIKSSDFNTIVNNMKNANLTVIVYSFQYAEQAFYQNEKDYHFNLCDYGMPSVYGRCNTASLCNELNFWTRNGFTPERLILAIVKGTWDTVQNYSFGSGTVSSSGFAGYIEWNYNLFDGTCKNYISCVQPDPC